MTGYNKMEKETSKSHKVFYDEKKVCNRGRVRYQLDLARQKKYPVTEEFAAAVCRLPEQYNQEKYLKFIDDWGTVRGVNLIFSFRITHIFFSPIDELALWSLMLMSFLWDIIQRILPNVTSIEMN